MSLKTANLAPDWYSDARSIEKTPPVREEVPVMGTVIGCLMLGVAVARWAVDEWRHRRGPSP